MTKSEKFESGLLLILFILSCFVCGYWCYWKLTYTNHTHITNYAQRLTYTEDGEYPIEINIFTNENGNGKGVFEMKFNYYMDTKTISKRRIIKIWLVNSIFFKSIIL